jgi:hypothetical protein
MRGLSTPAKLIFLALFQPQTFSTHLQWKIYE